MLGWCRWRTVYMLTRTSKMAPSRAKGVYESFYDAFSHSYNTRLTLTRRPIRTRLTRRVALNGFVANASSW